jgi:flavin reductase (DIM6/NTAB) family NADH-FMN oxidoreductase RutF
MPIDDATFKLGLSHFASGVTLVTTEYEGERFGMTVASFCSLSLHPPLVLVCLEKSARTHEAVTASGVFGVSILARDQEALSGRFASRKIDDKFSGVPTRRGELGVPLIEGAICTLECRVHDLVKQGDHTIVVGEVIDVQAAEGSPLLYFRSGYRDLA